MEWLHKPRPEGWGGASLYMDVNDEGEAWLVEDGAMVVVMVAEVGKNKSERIWLRGGLGHGGLWFYLVWSKYEDDFCKLQRNI
ncbi:hypothetical protein SESBI_27074 [Sesbania bispinosa]|nr:hypothetical protein SESBI_27074 [Sesbania bispinosa]